MSDDTTTVTATVTHAGHSHQARLPTSPWARRTGLAVLAAAAVLTVTGLVWLWPPAGAAQPGQAGAEQRVAATVVSVHPTPCPAGETGAQPAPVPAACGTVQGSL